MNLLEAILAAVHPVEVHPVVVVLALVVVVLAPVVVVLAPVVAALYQVHVLVGRAHARLVEEVRELNRL